MLTLAFPSSEKRSNPSRMHTLRLLYLGNAMTRAISRLECEKKSPSRVFWLFSIIHNRMGLYTE